MARHATRSGSLLFFSAMFVLIASPAWLSGGHPGDGRLDGRLGRRGLLGACVMGLDQLPVAWHSKIQ